MEESKKVLSVKDSRSFSRAYRKGACFCGRFIVLYCLRSRFPGKTRVGFTVSKDRGNAVVRNRVRRRLREAYRMENPYIADNYIIVIVAKQSCVDACFTVIKDELHELLTKAAVIKAKEQ